MHVDGAGVLLLEYQLRLRGVVRFITYRTYYYIRRTSLKDRGLMNKRQNDTFRSINNLLICYDCVSFCFELEFASGVLASAGARAHSVAELTKSSILGHPLAPVAQVCRRIDGGIDKRPRSSAKATQSTP